MSDLDHLAEKFKQYKGNRSYCRYPEHLWEKAYELTHHYPLQDVASALSMSPQYLSRFLSLLNASIFEKVSTGAGRHLPTKA